MSKRRSLSTFAAACWFVTAALPLTSAPAEPQVVRVGGNVAQANLITKVTPLYPPDAKKARIQGQVLLSVRIDTDGKVKNIAVQGGPEELVQSAVDAVSQWIYRPTLLNGEPVVVQTVVTVNYTLSQ